MRIIFCVILFTLVHTSRAQTILNWSDLSEGISWEPPSAEMNLPGFQKATFTPVMKALEGKQVTITGYMLVLGGGQTVYLLSKNPMASCFFCGNGGPETILQISFVENTSFQMDDLITVTGLLGLNSDDPTRCYYLIERAEAFRL